MGKFLKDWSFSAFVGVLFGLLLFILWLFLARVAPSVLVVFFGVLELLALAAMVVYSLNHADGGMCFMHAVLIAAVFYISGAAFKLDWLTLVGLPAGLQCINNVWVLHIFFGALYWIVISMGIIILMLWVDSKQHFKTLLYVLTAGAAAFCILYAGNMVFSIV